MLQLVADQLRVGRGVESYTHLVMNSVSDVLLQEQRRPRATVKYDRKAS